MNQIKNQMNFTAHPIPSEFRGKLLDYILRKIIGTLITIFTLGIMAPWAVVLMQRWKINNTYINGHRLQFTGTAIGLFGNYIKWWFLTVITLGIYGFWLHIKMRQWVISHTHFA